LPIYSTYLTVPAGSSNETEIWIEGDVITYVSLRFPPGSHALLKISVWYGDKKIFPSEEDEYFQGDGEVIAWQEYFEMPESTMRLIIKGQNDDATYSHSVYLRFATLSKDALFIYEQVKDVYSLLEKLLQKVLGSGKK